MRIGVMTFWWGKDNYGRLLQCHALQKYLLDLRCGAFLIRYQTKENMPFWLEDELIMCGLRLGLFFDNFKRDISRGFDR